MGYLDNNGLLYFWQKLKTMLAGKVDKVDGKGLSTNDYTTAEKTKLSGLSNYTLPTASSSTLGGIKVGTNLSINGSGVLSATDTTYSAATTSASGLMSSSDKTKLDGIAANANNYSLPTASATTLGGVKIGDNLTITNGVLSAVQGTYTLPTASSSVLGGVKVGTNLSINASGVLSATDTKYNPATSSANGLMSSSDKSKLDAFGAASTYALKTDITNMYKYKGSVATVSALPSTGNTTGDVYNVEAGGMNYAWDGSKWDALGEIFTITAVTNAEIDTIVAS